MVKLYICYMIGGCFFKLLIECLYSFEFFEYFGVLFKFLSMFGIYWNISLFNYCNYGVDYGCVLCGFELDILDLVCFLEYLVEFGYCYKDEIDNFVYCFFLVK